jgi:hemoglobin
MPTSNTFLERATLERRYVASVHLRLDDAITVGVTPDGVRMQFAVEGTVEGAELRGEFRRGTLAFLRIDRDGVGTIDVRAPLFLRDGARAELIATGRYDFGEDGFSKASQGPEHLPDSDLGWCPRLVTLDSRYLWLNRTQFLGLGRLVPSQRRVDYDLFAVRALPGAPAGPGGGPSPRAAAGPSLYERLGRREGIYRIMSACIDSLHGNEQLTRQNPKVAAANERLNVNDLKQKVTDFICHLSGGPCLYRGRSMRSSHGALDITESDWRLFVADTRKVLGELGVPSADATDMLALLEGSKAEIVKPS